MKNLVISIFVLIFLYNSNIILKIVFLLIIVSSMWSRFSFQFETHE